MTDINIGEEKLPSVINDPFKKIQVECIHVFYRKSIWSSDNGKFKATGTIDFVNGNTKGVQSFEGSTFDEVVLKTKACLENIE